MTHSRPVDLVTGARRGIGTTVAGTPFVQSSDLGFLRDPCFSFVFLRDERVSRFAN
jgi:hypothetical protein